MFHTTTARSLTAPLTSLLLCLAPACVPDTSLDDIADESIEKEVELLGSASGTVFGTGGELLNVRAEPTTASAIIGTLAPGASVSISCQVEGEPIQSNPVWDYLPDEGGYVSDAFINTGFAGTIPGVPDCDGGDVPEDCETLGYAGACDGNTLHWCEDDMMHAYDCASTEKTCGYQNSSVGYNCIGSTSSPGGMLSIGDIIGQAAYSVSQYYGPTGFDGPYDYCHAYGSWGGQEVHCGLDIAIAYGTPLYIPADAQVVVSGETPYFEDETQPSAGELRVRLNDGAEIILGHMSSIAVGSGQSVLAGSYAGSSGTANGPHLHLEVRVPDGAYASGFRTVDPISFFGL